MTTYLSRWPNWISQRRRQLFTQSHILLNAAVFAQKKVKDRSVAVVAGAIFPDSDVWLMFIVERICNTPGCEILHYRYLQELSKILRDQMQCGR
jgi:hypothetical protein